MATLLLLLLLLLPAHLSRGTFFSTAQKSCATADGGAGVCLSLRECPPLWNALESPSARTPRLYEFIWRQRCGGFDGVYPIVCCGANGAPRLGGKDRVDRPSEDSLIETRVTELLPESCGTIAAREKIFAGEEAALREHPWMTLLFYRCQGQRICHRCGGTLINRRYVLTAAHCLDSTLEFARLGEFNTATEEDCDEDGSCAPQADDVPVRSYTVHPEYFPGDERELSKHDIGLARLERDVDFGEGIGPICLPKKDEAPGKKAVVVGWGRTESGETDVLMKAKIDVFDDEKCGNYRGNVDPSIQICAGGVGTKDSCNGDSGGPLLSVSSRAREPGRQVYVQFGIVSAGSKSCNTIDYPGIYTKVAVYVDWILSEMERENYVNLTFERKI